MTRQAGQTVSAFSKGSGRGKQLVSGGEAKAVSGAQTRPLVPEFPLLTPAAGIPFKHLWGSYSVFGARLCSGLSGGRDDYKIYFLS